MKPEDLKAGQKAEMLHSRKGTIVGVVKENDRKSEWISLYLLHKVKGLVNEWKQGEELTVRKEFLSSIKLLEYTGKKEKQHFPVNKWGKDHWSLLAYIETRAVNHRGVLDLRHMRVNAGKRGFSNGNPLSHEWNPEYATRLQNGRKPDPAHDDIDVMDNLKEQGYLTYKCSCGKFIVGMTEYGNVICSLIRVHKTAGKNFNEFKLSEQLA